MISVRKTFGVIYARIIQQTYRRYKKKPASLAKCAWNAIRYYDNREELRNFVSLFSQLDEKRRLYCILLGISAVTLLLNVLFLKGYIMQDWPPWTSWPSWTDVFKWAQNPEYYQFATEKEWRKRINSLKYYHNFTKEIK